MLPLPHGLALALILSHALRLSLVRAARPLCRAHAALPPDLGPTLLLMNHPSRHRPSSALSSASAAPLPLPWGGLPASSPLLVGSISPPIEHMSCYNQTCPFLFLPSPGVRPRLSVNAASLCWFALSNSCCAAHHHKQQIGSAWVMERKAFTGSTLRVQSASQLQPAVLWHRRKINSSSVFATQPHALLLGWGTCARCSSSLADDPQYSTSFYTGFFRQCRGTVLCPLTGWDTMVVQALAAHTNWQCQSWYASPSDAGTLILARCVNTLCCHRHGCQPEGRDPLRSPGGHRTVGTCLQLLQNKERAVTRSQDSRKV